MSTGSEPWAPRPRRKPLRTLETPVNVEICTDPVAWDAYLDRVPSASNYHYWRWRTPIEQTFGHEPYYLAARDADGIRGVLPLVLVRSRLFGTSLVSMPFFSYGGVLADTPEARDSLLQRAAGLASEVGARHVELRQGDACQLGWQEKKSKVAMCVPLPAQPEELMGRLSPGVRKKIRQAPRYGLKAQWGGVESLDVFYGIFAQNMRNLGTPVYPREWFANLLRCAPEAIRILTIWDGGDAVAGAFLIAFRDTLEVPWAASLPDSRRKNCNLFLYWTFLEWAIQQGYRSMDLGRCTPGGGNYEFKRHWRGEEKPLHWYYWLASGAALPELRPDAGRYQLATRIWRHLPLPIANELGPRIVRGIP